VPKATKRERQRQNRDARRQAMMEAEKRRRRMRTGRNLAFLLIPLVILFVVLQVTNNSDSSSKSSSSGPTNFKTTCDSALPAKATKTKYTKPGLGIDTSKQYTAVLHTSEGDVTIALDAKQFPQSVNSFIYLSCQGFYNGTTFHRIITDFVDQGGDPTGTGKGGPGYTIKDEPPKSAYTEDSVAMANSGSGTTGSQFFLVVSANGAKTLGGPPYLYSGLGKMDAAGLAVAQKINTFGGPDPGTPTKAITINGVTITDGSTPASTTTVAPTTTTKAP
jgi:cyclophilin family peptidyl-prolyl cis-trans isomerase